MKSKLFGIAMMVGILVLLAALIAPLSYSAAIGDVSKVHADNPAEAFATSQAQDFATEAAEAPSEDATVAYTYDDVGRLIEVEYPNGTIITYTYDAVGNRVSKTVFIPEATMDISVVLQGGSRPPEGWEVPITIKFFSQGADVMTDTPLEQFDLTTTKSGSTAICQCTVAPGTYDITAVSEHTLINVKSGVVISTPSTAVNMSTLLEGNANDDIIINISDFGILAVSYMKMEGEPGYDARADFDRNGIINISDFGLLAVNYMKISPIDISE